MNTEQINDLIFKALLLDGNETSVLSNEHYNKFRGLLVELVKVSHNIRWCNNKNCPCHPEVLIRGMIESKQLEIVFEQMYESVLYLDICEFIKQDYEIITVYDKMEML